MDSGIKSIVKDKKKLCRYIIAGVTLIIIIVILVIIAFKDRKMIDFDEVPGANDRLEDAEDVSYSLFGEPDEVQMVPADKNKETSPFDREWKTEITYSNDGGLDAMVREKLVYNRIEYLGIQFKMKVYNSPLFIRGIALEYAEPNKKIFEELCRDLSEKYITKDSSSTSAEYVVYNKYGSEYPLYISIKKSGIRIEYDWGQYFE